jgi:phage protein U
MSYQRQQFQKNKKFQFSDEKDFPRLAKRKKQQWQEEPEDMITAEGFSYEDESERKSK